MALSRRQIIQMLLAATAVVPVRQLEPQQGALVHFPGRVIALDGSAVETPAQWKG